ncbi:NAD(P)-dependent oxidoreductase [Lacipirellula sp.]|uniref:NAD(P)-dependent oxidoreductase n=1 Tax=Lacipirellula sp. TaxID=2691419 RepID=UPI003D0EFFD1
MADRPRDRKPIGLIGLGLMGTAICERLLATGYELVIHNRTADKAAPLVERGARWSENPLRECDRVIISLYTTEVVEEVLSQLEDAYRPGKLLIDTTTGDPQLTASLGARLATHGVDYLEVPISGSSEQTRRGQTTAMVAGPLRALDACRDLLDAIAAKTYYVGQWGDGVRMKLVTNLVLGLNRAVLAEGLVFAKSMGLSTERTLEVLLNSPASSRTMENKGPKMVAGEFAPQAKLSQHLKDVRLIIDEAARRGRELPLTALHVQLLERAEADGLGELDNSVIIRAIEEGLLPATASGAATRGIETLSSLLNEVE